MLASDSSWNSIAGISATLPGGFSSLWVNQEKTRIGNQLRRSDADNRAIGGTLSLNSLWSKLGTFSISYNDRRYNALLRQITIKVSTAVPLVRLACRPVFHAITTATAALIQEIYALDLSLPLGNWFSAGDDPSKRLHHGKPVSTQTV